LTSDTTIDALFIVNRVMDFVFLFDLMMNMLMARFDEKSGIWKITLATDTIFMPTPRIN
jgi:hypothetical protein